jgi:hypothetical protein
MQVIFNKDFLQSDRQDITEIFLNVALNNINLIQTISKGVVFSIKIKVLLDGPVLKWNNCVL